MNERTNKKQTNEAASKQTNPQTNKQTNKQGQPGDPKSIHTAYLASLFKCGRAALPIASHQVKHRPGASVHSRLPCTGGTLPHAVPPAETPISPRVAPRSGPVGRRRL